MKIDNEEALLELGRRLTPIIMSFIGNASRHLEGHGVTHDMVVSMGFDVMEGQHKLNSICPIDDIVFINMLINCAIAIAIPSAQGSGVPQEEMVGTMTALFLSHLTKFNDEFDDKMLKAVEVQGHA